MLQRPRRNKNKQTAMNNRMNEIKTTLEKSTAQ